MASAGQPRPSPAEPAGRRRATPRHRGRPGRARHTAPARRTADRRTGAGPQLAAPTQQRPLAGAARRSCALPGADPRRPRARRRASGAGGRRGARRRAADRAPSRQPPRDRHGAADPSPPEARRGLGRRRQPLRPPASRAAGAAVHDRRRPAPHRPRGDGAPAGDPGGLGAAPRCAGPPALQLDQPDRNEHHREQEDHGEQQRDQPASRPEGLRLVVQTGVSVRIQSRMANQST